MKKFILITVLVCVAVCMSCTQKTVDSENALAVENTLKSVSFVYDSTGIDPHQLFLSLEQVNKAIDSIGYPDAGYKLYLIQSDTVRAFRFMMEGNWPNQDIYDVIHDHELYINAMGAIIEQEDWKALNTISYNRFTMVE